MQYPIHMRHGRNQLRQAHHVPRYDFETRVGLQVLERGQRSLREVVENDNLAGATVQKQLSACRADQACASNYKKAPAVDRHGLRLSDACN
jgi:hypothetical protein